MPDDFNPDNAIAVTEHPATGITQSNSDNFSLDNAISVDAPHTGETAYDQFKASDSQNKADGSIPSDNGSKVPLRSKEGQPKGNPTGVAFDKNLDYPHEDFLNASLHLAEGATWNTLAKPFQSKPDPDMDQYLSQLEQKHPIAHVVAGTAPFIASAAFLPETLIPNIYARTAAQFGLVGFTGAFGHAKVDEPNKPILDKVQEVALETAKQTAFSPIYAKAQVFQILDRPFASALARAGIITGGTGVMSTFFGDNIVEAFKQSGVYGALSLIMESPYLAKTALGRGVIARQNAINPEVKIDAEAPDVANQIAKSAEATAKEIKGIDKPQIVAATIKLKDGSEIHGASHEEALNKIQQTENTVIQKLPTFRNTESAVRYGESIKGKTEFIDDLINRRKETETKLDEYKKIDNKTDAQLQEMMNLAVESQLDREALQRAQGTEAESERKLSDRAIYPGHTSGFTVLEPDGKTRFITKEEATKEPFNLKTGNSNEVPGLNESKFLNPQQELKIVNPTIKPKSDEAGSMNVNMIPGVAETAEILQRSHEELREKMTPYAVGEEGKYTAATIRENLGVLARSHDRLEQALLQAKKVFDKADKDSSLDFVYRMEDGQNQATPELQKVANTLRNMLDSKRDEIRALGTGKLENFIENYFPHMWESPDKAGNIIKAIMGRRPFEGTKSFLKKRTIPTTREGVELGLKPINYNPIDAVMLKVREMDRYLMAQRSIQALKEQGLVKFVALGKEAPEGFVKIDDRFADVVSKNEAGELVIRGKYMAQKDAARILNNYLSPGLAGKSYIYDLYRDAGNTLNQFQLGFTAFHLGFTSMEATTAKFALGINKLSGGDYAGAIKEFSKAPFAPITNILQGRELLQAWYGKDMGELTNTIADIMATAGGRAKMDKFYATGAKESIQKSLKEGKVLTGAMKVPFYLVEQVARPIMEYIVPRQKLGIFMDLVKMEIERNPNISHEQMRAIAQRAWDSVDNRMGQFVYDNLFWNKVVKDLSMASVRSLGWNLGTVREIGGGIKDIGEALSHIPSDIINARNGIRRKATPLSYRAAYVMALPIVTGIYGAIYQYLHTGQGPQELKDYFFPKTGGIDKHGQEARVSLPTYMKDIYHYKTNPVQTISNKFSPVNSAVMQMLNNKDFYGTQIRNVDDPVIQQILDESIFLKSQFVPFGFRNLGKDTRKSTGSQVEPFIGITPAPYDIDMTAAEKEASELGKAKIPVGSRTKAQADHSSIKSQLRSDYMATKDDASLAEAVADGTISSKEKKQIIKESGMSNLKRLTLHLGYEEVVHLLKKASPEEKEELQDILLTKRSNKQKSGTWTKEEEALHDKTFKPEG